MTQTSLNFIFSTSFLHWCFTSDLVWRWPTTSGPIKTLNAAKCLFVTHDSACKRKIMSGKGENCCRLLISRFIWLFCQVCLTHWMSQACFCFLLSALFHLLSQVMSIGEGCDVTRHDRGSWDVSLHTDQTGLAEIVDQHNLRRTVTVQQGVCDPKLTCCERKFICNILHLTYFFFCFV